jgi:hypothetical protein
MRVCFKGAGCEAVDGVHLARVSIQWRPLVRPF